MKYFTIDGAINNKTNEYGMVVIKANSIADAWRKINSYYEIGKTLYIHEDFEVIPVEECISKKFQNNVDKVKRGNKDLIKWKEGVSFQKENLQENQKIPNSKH